MLSDKALTVLITTKPARLYLGMLGTLVGFTTLCILVDIYVGPLLRNPAIPARCGCFREGGEWSCWLEDAGGSVLRLLAIKATLFVAFAAGFALVLAAGPRWRWSFFALAIASFTAWVFLSTVGLPGGACLGIE